MYKFNLFYVVYCMSCKETSITATDSVEIEINEKLKTFNRALILIVEQSPCFHMNAHSKIFSHVSHLSRYLIISRVVVELNLWT